MTLLCPCLQPSMYSCMALTTPSLSTPYAPDDIRARLTPHVTASTVKDGKSRPFAVGGSLQTTCRGWPSHDLSVGADLRCSDERSDPRQRDVSNVAPRTLTVLAAIRPGEEEPLRAVLRPIGDDIKGKRLEPGAVRLASSSATAGGSISRASPSSTIPIAGAIENGCSIRRTTTANSTATWPS